MSGVTTGVTLAGVAETASIAGAAIGAIGAIQQGKAASASANYNSEVAANNAKIATQNANLAIQEGNAAVEQQQVKTRAEVGAIKANQAAGGIDVNTGSAVDVRSSAAQTGELSAINIRANAARTAYGYQTGAASDTGQAALDKSEASSAGIAGDIGGAATALSGAGNAALNYNKFVGSNSLPTISDPAQADWLNGNIV